MGGACRVQLDEQYRKKLTPSHMVQLKQDLRRARGHSQALTTKLHQEQKRIETLEKMGLSAI
eukprot:NODE_1519_length_530_cov_44.719335_g1442_i0.p2 GENE.NODE_1519_length_530_cov_44.719335_g1442_i0~~NODE_1519_length_530_cov_44.719335_g1442_i0.p2  ORF type:complete len:70 (+),score=26.43 NODE_1519_length_530_cov_44.719335_g1442_i0:26-211(+)